MKTTWYAILLVFIVLLVPRCSDDDSTTNPSTPTAYDNASRAKGGLSYDKFWSSETGFDQTDPNIAVFSAAGDFFRCKQCHAWDLLGNAGSYISRGPKTTRPNVSSLNLFEYVKTKTPQELFDGLKKTAGRRDITADLSTYDPATNNTVGDQMPNMNQIFTDEQIWNFVKFLKEGVMDVSELYDATYTGTYPTGKATFTNVGRDGNAENGKTYYAAHCAQCHGPTGETMIIEDMTIGQFARNKPNEVQHKVMYGQPGSPMTGDIAVTVGQLKDLYKALSNTTDFPDNN